MLVKKAEYEALLKKVKRLQEKVDTTIRDALEATEKCANINYSVDQRMEDYTKSILGRLDAIDKQLDKKLEKRINDIEESLPHKIEEKIRTSKIEDAVLLKVVKATFNNYKDGDNNGEERRTNA